MHTQTDKLTVSTARRRLKKAVANGEEAVCDVCESRFRRYQRNLSASNVECLKLITSSKDGMSTRTLTNRLRARAGRQQHMLKYWDLVTYEDKKWKATEKGHQFVKGKIEIPRYAYVCEGFVVGHSTETISIRHFS